MIFNAFPIVALFPDCIVIFHLGTFFYFKSVNLSKSNFFKDQMIIFKHTCVFWRTAPLTPESSLSSVDLEVGDLVAVHVEVY